MIRRVLLAALLIAAAAAAPDDEAAIRSLRAENNAALAARDGTRLARAYAPGYVFIRGYSGEVGRDADSVARTLAATDWRDPTFVGYVRVPARVEIASDRKRAAESGRWTGTWRAPAPVTRRTGEYLAVWVPTPDGWRLRSETFVALGCEGPGC